MKQKVIAIVGPTAVGKTKLSIEVAKKYNGEIISGDSMQVYKGMDIGTAKIKKEEMQGIPHHMIDIKNPDEEFSVADFQYYVQKYINEITERNHIPIIVGGSGLYIQAVLNDYNFSKEKRDDTLTKKLEAEMKQFGIEHLFNRLQKIDPIQAQKIHPNNYRRVIRALEIYENTGLTMTEYQKEQSDESPYDSILIGLEMERELLYNRINERIDLMIEEGLLKEVNDLVNNGYENYQSMKAIGYKELIPYVKGEMPLEESIELLKRNSRRYAKRQYTWFKNKMDVNWYNLAPFTINESFDDILVDLAGFIES
ncbi:tRNA (adenosine(37)-N6)-dimethylallyltransferase MiaA [Ornithinibacillus halotolerans]|uniref:tRNA dimethylallyltransferase n=1 Tax=Ornithinibacillus halotolerans TaxID=1274357 RepID=A0A916RN48_9BACI|nr:tRNA (adenosine(37)-N6)-dimethylallyltransferase MiaA [Ornithinibacillus halotolerans]GGA62395.1 tRNA dimethylallyltransferase [Ornithinibacillus halotolerans]